MLPFWAASPPGDGAAANGRSAASGLLRIQSAARSTLGPCDCKNKQGHALGSDLQPVSKPVPFL